MSDNSGYYTFSETNNSSTLQNILSTEIQTSSIFNTIVSTGEGLIHLHNPARNCFDNAPLTKCVFDWVL